MPVVVYGSWLGMLALHELGHVAHAVLSGGRVAGIVFPLVGFSQTIVHPNPRPLFVVWGGPVWGALLPVMACAVIRFTRVGVPQVLRFFAGFCLIANGAYVGAGWLTRAGDAGDMMDHGTPVPVMVVFGTACIAAGLYAWHRTRGVAGIA